MNLTKVFLFDLDGSLADYEGAVLADLNRLRGPDEPLLTVFTRELWSQPHLKQRIDLITARPGWWADLVPLERGMAVYRLAKAMGFNCQILTKGPRRQPRAWMEKVEWCQRHLGSEVDIHIVSDKGLVYGVALYDDYPAYVEAWLEHRPRGLVVMPVTAGNGDFRHRNVVRYDGTNLAEVEKAMAVVFARKPGEDLRLPSSPS
jgi:5'-nucleotidase